MNQSHRISQVDRWAACGLAFVLCQCSAEGWLAGIWPPAGLLWRLVLLVMAALWLVDWTCRSRTAGYALPAAIAVLVTAVAVAFDELVAVAGAENMPRGLSPRVAVVHDSLYWLGGALGACLWQMGWAAGDRSPGVTDKRGVSPGAWLLAAALWIWLLYPAGLAQPDHATLWPTVALLAALGLPLLERHVFLRSGSPWSGAMLRFMWWGVFASRIG